MRRPGKTRRYTWSTFDVPGESRCVLRFIRSKPTGEFMDLGRVAYERAEARKSAKAKKKAAKVKKKAAEERERLGKGRTEGKERLARTVNRNAWLAGAQRPLMIEIRRRGRRIARKPPGDVPAQN